MRPWMFFVLALVALVGLPMAYLFAPADRLHMVLTGEVGATALALLTAAWRWWISQPDTNHNHIPDALEAKDGDDDR